MRDYFSRGELILWAASVLLTGTAFFIFDKQNYLVLAATLTGATSLILCAKGNPAGQLLMIAFSVMYGIISYSCRYYGEMITYMGMTAPMALISMIAWFRNPYGKGRSQVKVRRTSAGDVILTLIVTAAVTVLFYFILEAFGTANIVMSTVSVATSFAAVSLTFIRSRFFALAYAMNDIVLIIMWAAASVSDRSYVFMTVCFVMFLANDIYGYISWRAMEKRQSETAPAEKEDNNA